MELLTHHGIKGQKWGVKNGPPYPIDKSERKMVALKKGSTAYRVATIPNETDKGYAFISYKDKDHEKYINSTKAMQEVFGNAWEGFDMTLKVTKDLVVPTKKYAVDELIKAVSRDPALKKEYAKAASKMHIFKPSPIIKKELESAKSEKEVAKIYRDISLAAATSSDFRNKYFSRLQSQGYSAMYDGGDMDGKGANTEAPILVFERKGYLDVVDVKAITS